MAPDLNPPAAAVPFLASVGWDDAEIQPLAGDASFRRYFRVVAPRAHRDPDGRAAAARGPAPRSCGRALARRARLRGARDPGEELGEDLVLIEDFGNARCARPPMPRPKASCGSMRRRSTCWSPASRGADGAQAL